jgi:polyisoprenoid-binding protein YceI
MTLKTARQMALGASAAALLMACSQAEQKAEAMADTVKASATTATEATKTAVASAAQKTEKVTEKLVDGASAKMQKPAADLTDLPSGTYKSEQGHAYVAFTYWHQGYTKPILRWGETNATIVFDNENPENSTLEVMIPVSSIDSGVPKFDEHLVSADFFDAANHPTITFKSTAVNQVLQGKGSVMGDLTVKGITKPVLFTGRINKVGKNFRSGVDMFGVSAVASVKRSDFGVDKYAPNVGDDVEIMVEVEFQKAE